ncbi:MAG: HD domain-containing protein [Actinobacteria bacterium]|nr:HD domain-containing protein [Actinomycetota bacterium]
MRTTDKYIDIAEWKRALVDTVKDHVHGTSHDFGHLERVCRMVEVIVAEEGGDLEVLIAAAFLHDTGRKDEADTGIDHAETGAQWAEKALANLGFPPEKIPGVVGCIRAHRFRGKDAPQSLEEKILFDADKLDAMGAIGVARAYAHAGANNQQLFLEPSGHSVHYDPHESYSPVIEYELKLRNLKDRLYTETGRRIARKRHEYMDDFFNRLRQEVRGFD